jgi:probable rRNA maturation factor
MHFRVHNKKYITHQELAKIAIATHSIIKKYKPNLHKISTGHAVSLNFISDKEIQILNSTYRKKDKPTDVLSWGFLTTPLNQHELAGEIYVSIDTLKVQAKQKRKTIKQELIFLIVHGLLHIFEYDHNTDEEELEMNMLTDEILGEI